VVLGLTFKVRFGLLRFRVNVCFMRVSMLNY
jgi:hypothetical protein